jgi:hypothetical protein
VVFRLPPKNKILPVPGSFCVLPFYRSGSSIQVIDSLAPMNEVPFFKDILYAAQPDALTDWPWTQPENSLKQRWEERSPGLRDAFHRRDKTQVRTPMICALAEFIERMFWGEGRPVTDLSQEYLSAQMSRMTFSPLNLNERLSYIASQPDRYLSFIQLDKLQEELTKKMAVFKSKRDH